MSMTHTTAQHEYDSMSMTAQHEYDTYNMPGIQWTYSNINTAMNPALPDLWSISAQYNWGGGGGAEEATFIGGGGAEEAPLEF